jgi:hypothetical protein
MLTVLLALSAFAAAPTPGSPEATISASLVDLRDGKPDAFIADWCAPTLCRSPEAIEQLKTFAIARATPQAASCLRPDEAIEVVRTKGDPATDDTITVYIKCSAERMPVPSRLVKVDGVWKVDSFSW